ncbi:MAG: hypothetical protein PVI86_13340 [Phycisphaerae bacterium]|jgi:hypothetical protein
MPPKRLEGHVIADLMRDWPDELCDRALELWELRCKIVAKAWTRCSMFPNNVTRS